MTCWAKIRHIYFNRSIAMVSLHCWFWGDWSTCWKFKKVKCFLCLMVQDGLPSSQAEFLPPGASHPYSGESSSCLLCHLMTREEVGFMRKTCLAWQNSSIFLLSEKNGGEKWFHDNLSLVNQFQVFLKTWNRVQIHDEAEEVRHLETTFSDCCPSSEINFIQVIIKLHKFILKYILSKRLLTIILNFWFILYITQFIHYTILNFSELLYNCTIINTHFKKNS